MMNQKQEQLPDRSLKKAGQRAKNRPSRQQLLLEFDLHKQAQAPGSLKQQYFLCDPYPPSTKVVSELCPIGTSELERDIHHRGKVLFIRTIDTPIRVAAVHSIVQDSTGAAERLALYNTDVTVSAEEVLPEDAIFAIKEPFYMIDSNGTCTLRIDHPSDLWQLNPLGAHVPRDLRANLEGIDKPTIEWKQEGNVAYTAKNYLAALRAYSHGLDACSFDNEAIKYDLLRNRAIVNTFLKRFEQALADAKAAIIPAEESKGEEATALNSKAYERAGRAAYELGRFQEAETLFSKMQELTPTSEIASSTLRRIGQRKQESCSGDYDFEKMSGSTTKKHTRLDYADYISNTTIRDTATHGKGLFATKDISAGQLIMCEKATCVAFEADEKSQSYTILNHNTKRAVTGTQATLLFTCVQKMVHNLEQATRFFDLFDGGYSPKTPLRIVDGLVPVDAFRIQAIIEYNSFECPAVRSSSKAARKQATSSAGYHSTGLWLRAPLMNHACDGNALRSFIGDMMIVRATKDISKGDELLMPYRLPDADNTTTQGELKKTWGFNCDCDLCTVEAVSSLSQQRYRSQLNEKARDLLSVSPLLPQYQSKKSSLAQVEQLYTKLKSTYDERAFKNKPRLGLVTPGLWLCQAYKRKQSHDKTLKQALALLRDLGYIVTVAEHTISIDRRHCLMDGTAIDAAMYTAHAYCSRGDTEIGHQMEEFARSLYVIINGELRDFEDRYKGQ